MHTAKSDGKLQIVPLFLPWKAMELGQLHCKVNALLLQFEFVTACMVVVMRRRVSC